MLIIHWMRAQGYCLEFLIYCTFLVDSFFETCNVDTLFRGSRREFYISASKHLLPMTANVGYVVFYDECIYSEKQGASVDLNKKLFK